jgi:hypothetical protein
MNSLYLIHCGYYDEEISDGIYEFHVNIPIVAETLEQAKKLVRQEAPFIKKKMHIDGIQEIKTVSGFRVQLVPNDGAASTEIQNHLHRDL